MEYTVVIPEGNNAGMKTLTAAFELKDYEKLFKIWQYVTIHFSYKSFKWV